MPKIEVYQDALFGFAGKRYNNQELEEILVAAKAELDEPVNEEGIVKIELNDTNRPDLWSSAGLGRQLRVYAGGKIPHYGFFSSADKTQDFAERKIIVDSRLAGIRPFVAGFAARGKTVDEAILADLIQTQEKLCRGFGQKRKSIAMGIYRSKLITYPVHYKAADPDKASFVPLESEAEMSLRQIIKENQKGQEYGHIVADFPLFPLLTDDRGEVLSFPPVINSAHIGAVEVGDSELFVELTGTDQKTLCLALNILACDMADMGFEILPVKVVYPAAYGAEPLFGQEIVTPFYFQTRQSAGLDFINKLLGVKLSSEEVKEALARAGLEAEGEEEISILPPAYRNDFLHPVDIMEEVMIGRGMDSFEPEMPHDFTVGRLSPTEILSRKVKDLMVGLGYQEMIFNYLSSARDYIWRMHPDMQDALASLKEGQGLDDLIKDARVVKIMNPMSENFEYVRPSIIPSLLSAESVSGNAVYPHHIFETGKVVQREEQENYGSRTWTSLGFLSADASANFNQVYSVFGALSYYLGWEFQVEEGQDQRFIPGRCVAVLVKGTQVGVFGEIQPGILENWGIELPCTAGEFDLDQLIMLGFGA